MKSIAKITKENFNSSFNLIDLLQESVYYPASGVDAAPIEVFGDKYCSFINVDYSVSYDDVRRSMEFDFEPVGYKLIGIKDIIKEELSPNGISPINFRFNEHEKSRLEEHLFIKELFDNAIFSGFAIWAVYELDDNFTGKTVGRSKRFSLLHIRAEGWAAFEGLYVENKTNPQAIAIIRPGEGYGDNWTLFTDSKFRLYQSIRNNEHVNEAEMPKYILTDAGSDEGFIWGEYAFSKEYNGCSLYELEENK